MMCSNSLVIFAIVVNFPLYDVVPLFKCTSLFGEVLFLDAPEIFVFSVS